MSESNANTQNRCKYFVQRKKRYCKMLVKSSEEFCGEHQKPIQISQSNTENDVKVRIVCPLDRKHTVYAHNLQKHLKICNARKDTVEPYISIDINSGKLQETDELFNDSYQLLSTFPTNKILAVIEKVNSVFQEHIRLSDKILSHEIVEEEIKKPEYGVKTKKHLKQASAILGLLENNDLLNDNTCYIEFGAGRGQLSCWIAEATGSFNNAKCLLVERASPKHKKDNKLAKTTERMHRIRADIKDLVLDKLLVVNDTESIVAITKHLCGEATDLAIRCMTNMKVNKNKLQGSVLTFCCHHRCRWTPYTGKSFFQDNNLAIEEFNIMCGLSSWATCGTGFSREYRAKIGESDYHQQQNEDYGLTREEREEIGRRCKNIINWGRLSYLEKQGFCCLLHNYVVKEITLENVCIVAYKKNYIKVNKV